MKSYEIIFFHKLIILTIVTVIKLTIINQDNEVKILEKNKIEKDIEKLEIDFAYISSLRN